MKGLTCFCFSLLCYSVSIERATFFVAASTVNRVGYANEDSTRSWKLFRRRSSLEVREESHWSEARQDRGRTRMFEKWNASGDQGTVLVPTDKCSRYCIKGNLSENGDSVEYVNIFWTVSDDNVTDDRPTKNDLLANLKWREAQSSSIVDENCQIYLDLDCNAAETETIPNYVAREFHLNVENRRTYENNFDRFPDPLVKIPIKIVDNCNLSEQTRVKFSIDNRISRIVIDVDGNISDALLQIPTNATAWRHGRVVSWTRKNDTNGVRIDALEALPGEWRLKLVGEDGSKYHLSVDGFLDEKNNGENLFYPYQPLNGSFNDVKHRGYHSAVETGHDISGRDKKKFNHVAKEQRDTDSTIGSDLMDNEKIIRERSLKLRSSDEEQNDRTREDNSYDNASTMISSNIEDELINFVEYVNLTANDTNVTDSPMNFSKKSSTRESLVEENFHPGSSIGTIEKIEKSDFNVSMRMIEPLDGRDLSDELTSYANENTIEEKRMLIDLNRNSNLLVTPGTIHRVVFDVKNNCVLPVRYAFRAKSTPFRLYNVQPAYAWVYPGQMSNIGVDLIVPDNAAPDTVNTVTLFILGTEIKEKSVYLYVQGSLSKLTDDAKPTIEYTFNNNCAGKLEKERCYKSRWSVDITIQDYESGLKRVISSPNDIFPRTEFISGTRSPITFYYSSTCCDKTARITATDLLDNYNTYTIDVTAWNNLSQAEIAAISVGALFALLLIVLLIILIVYCVRRRKSHDLPYTQRYGSRPPTQAERTNL